jgi:outer membrane protein assembly factor BamB
MVNTFSPRTPRAHHRRSPWIGLGLTILLAGLLRVPAVARAGDWPGWRGPTGQGHTSEKDLPLTWDAKTGKNVLWKVLLHGGVKNNQEMNSPGWSCPIVWGDRVLITTAVWPARLSREERKKVIPAHHVLCFRARDGKPQWDRVVPPGKCQVDNHYHGYAVPTPVADGKRIYALFGSGVIAALDLDGKIVWRKEIPRLRDVDGGICSSLVLYKDRVIVVGIAASPLRALDARTGEVKWEQKGRASNRMATPALLTVRGRTQLIFLAGGVQGIDPDSGKVLWSCRAPSGQSSPVFGAGLVYVDNGRGGREGAAVDPTGRGDVSKTNVKWQVKLTAPAGSSGIVVGDYLYRACNADLLRCWKMASGALVYEKKLPGISPSASPIASADGRIYFASPGKSYVIKAGPEFQLLATNNLGEGDPFTTPAVSGGRLFIKGRNYLWCIGAR